MSGSKISGIVFLDQNADGSEESGDTALGGVSVSLYTSGGVLVGMVTTATDGSYSFSGLGAGSYYVQATAPTGETFSPTGSNATLPNSSVGSTGKSATIALTGSNSSVVNAGLYVPVSISGTVFNDANGDGQVDGTDKGVAGVKVDLLNGSGLAVTVNGNAVTATTDSNGNYTFSNLAPGTYEVHVEMPASEPAGESFSPYGSNTPPQPTNGTINQARNLLVNGSFEDGEPANSYGTTAAGFSGWTVSANTSAMPYGYGPGNGPEIDWTNSATNIGVDPTGALNTFAGIVAPDNANPNLAGGSGTHAAFFVDDGAVETLSQSVYLTAGKTYEVGFDLDETIPGTFNPGYFQLTASFGSDTIVTASSTSGTALTPGTWTHFADLYTPTVSGNVTLTFAYASGTFDTNQLAKDVLVDDVYVVAGQITPNLTTTSEVNPGGTTAPVTLTSGQTVGDESAGLTLQPAIIQGTVFADQNADGAQEAGDAGIAGETVNLSLGGKVIATTTTDASGKYSFTEPNAGIYTVQVVQSAGGTGVFSPVGTSPTLTDSTADASGSTTGYVGNNSTGIANAGIYTPVTIKGIAFADNNGDGAQETGDIGLSPITVELLNASGTVVATTATNNSGAYSFANETPGTYSVKFIAPTGLAFSPAGTSTTLTDSNVSASGATAAVALNSGTTEIVNAGLFAPGTISGTVFNDLNADGTQESGDVGLPGQTVNLLNASGTTIATATTGANGGYSFTGVTPGADTVQFVGKSGDTFSTPSSDAVTVTSGSTSTANAGEYAPGTVSGTVFNDINADGAQETGDAGLSGQTVNLLNASGTTIATTTTGTNGTYSFSNVTPGADTVQFLVKSGDTFSTPSSDAVTVTSGSGSTVNAGEYAPGTISGTVFNDLNADGTQESGDAGLSGQTVNLLNASGTTVATTTTGANGTYSFTGVKPGSDTVRFVGKPGDAFSTPSSDAVTVTSGSSSTVNAGEYAPGTISGTVFNDLNADGTQQSGDAGLSGQTVNLLNAGGTTIATTTTGANGTYSFTGVTPGTDTVRFVAKSGDVFTTPSSDAVTVTSGSSSTENAGEYAPGTISGTVFTDNNADGVENGADTGLGGQTVNLVGPDGQTVIATTTTAANGSYSFTGVAPGADTVQFVPGSGLSLTTPASVPVTVTSGSSATVNAGEDAPSTINGTVFTDNNADGVEDGGDAGLGGQTVNLLGATGHVIATTTTANDGSYSFTGVAPGADTVQFVPGSGLGLTTPASVAVAVSSGSSTTVNAGEDAPSAISGTVYTDNNADGIEDGSDTGLGGQTVDLLGSTGHVIATTTTASNGSYSFTGVAPGADTVQFVPGSGLSLTTPASVPVTVSSGSSAVVNAGEDAPSTIGGTVYTDLNGDGVEDGGDTGLGGQTVNLVGPDGKTVIATTTTASNGSYSFTGVAPGADTVQFVPGSGLSLTTPASVPVTVTSGSSTTVNAGEDAPSTISGTVYTDHNADGVEDGSDTGLGGQTVNLVGPDGKTVIATTTTASNGSYSFTGVAPGADTVQFVPGAGLSLTTPASVPVTVTSGSSSTANAGEDAPSTISGTVYTDLNGDGVEDGADTGLGGQTVNLLGPDGKTVIATTTTASNGSYSFTGVAPGADTVRFVPGSGYSLTTPASVPVTVTSGSSPTANAGEDAPSTIGGTVYTDNNGDGVEDGADTGLGGQTVNLLGPDGQTVIATTTTAPDGSYSFTGVAPGADSVQFVPSSGDSLSTPSPVPVTVTSGSSTTVNAGVVAPSTISGTVFTDNNADGAEDGSDTGLGGQTVTLLGATGQVIATTMTNPDGTYSFTGVAPGSDTVQFAPLAGDAFSTPTGGSSAVTVTSGSGTTVNAGEYAPTSLTVLVYDDANADGTQDNGENGLAGVPVQLLNGSGTAVIAVANTNANGTVTFTGLTPGRYEALIANPLGYTVTQAVNVGTPITLTSGTPANAIEGLDAPPPGRIDGHVFVNTACTGLYQVGDANVAGVTVELLSGSGTPFVQNGTIVTTVTDANGDYSFTNIAAGTYEEKFILPKGLSFTTERAGTDNTINSAANQTSGLTDAFAVAGNSDVTTENAGVYLNGQSTNTPAIVAAGTAESFNTGSNLIVGAGNDNIHTNSGNNAILIGSQGSDGGNIVETGPGTDIVYSCSSLNAQALGSGTNPASNLGFADYLFGGSGTNDLQGGAGSDYLMGGPGYNLIAGGSGASEIVAGSNSLGVGSVTRDGTGAITGYTVNNEVRPGNSTSSIVYQAGDGVMLLDTFKPGQDTLTIYGYPAGTTATYTTANGHTILDLGGNDIIVFNDAYSPSSGGISFSTSTAPLLVLHFDASGMPYFDSATVNPATPAQTTSVVTSAATTAEADQITAVNEAILNGTAVAETVSGGSLPSLPSGVNGVAEINGSGIVLLTAGYNTAMDNASGPVTINAAAAGDHLIDIAGSGAFTYAGSSGADTIDAGSGDGLVFGAATAMTFFGGTGAATIIGGSGGNTVTGGAGSQLIFGSSSLNYTGGTGAATIIGGGNGNTVTGGAGNELIFASSGMTYQGGSGAATIIGGGGPLNANLGAGGGIAYGSPNGGNTLATGSGTAILVGGGEGDVLTATGNGNDTLVAGGGDETLNGAANNGNLVLFGGPGSDVMTGGTGTNLFIAESGNETLTGGGSTNSYLFIATAGTTRTDVITNFNTNTDAIGLFGYGSEPGADAAALASATTSGGNTTVSLTDGTHIVFTGVTQLHSYNFF
jgi:hypothetical protein